MTKIAILHRKTDDGREVDIEYLMRLIYETLEEKEPDLFVGPEYLFYGVGHTPFYEEGKNEVTGQLAELSEGSGAVIVAGSVIGRSGELYTNTVPVLFDGECVNEILKSTFRPADKAFCNKDVMGFSQDPADQYGFSGLATGLGLYAQPRTVEIEGLKYLIEVCDDHPFATHYDFEGTGRDGGMFEGPRSVLEVDYQIIVSNGCALFHTPRERLFVKEGGLLIECNGRNPSSFVCRAQGDEIIPIYESEKIAEEDVKLITVDD